MAFDRIKDWFVSTNKSNDFKTYIILACRPSVVALLNIESRDVKYSSSSSLVLSKAIYAVCMSQHSGLKTTPCFSTYYPLFTGKNCFTTEFIISCSHLIQVIG